MPDQVQLGGIDVFHLVNDRQMRACGLAGNHCAFVVEVEGRLDPARLEARLAAAVRAVPELGWRLHEPLLRPAAWVVDPRRAAPRVQVFDASDAQAMASRVEESLSRRVDGRAPWALDLVRGAERDVCVLRWFHALADAKAAERLTRWLGSGTGDAPEPPPPAEERFQVSERPIARLDRDTRMALMRAYNTHMTALGARPIVSLASVAQRAGSGRPGSVGATRVLRLRLTAEETRAFDQRVRQRAKLAETSVLLLAAARLADAALLARGHAPPQHLVPMPLSLDPKSGAVRMFGNHLTMMMLSIEREDLRDEARGIARLGDQQRAIVRQKLDLGMIAALDFARYLPGPAYRWLSTLPFGGEMGSFICSNPGAVGLETFAGLKVVDAHPLPTVVMPPGFQVIWSRFGGRLSATLVTVDSVVPVREAEGMLGALRADLLA